mmetsp:Transcript_49191/g.123664  ORF Transcript_49191/g.123664 Transcript_49191/m.123664 type:complete len:87 (+) Transcript_49191:132-392(+)
MTHKGSPPSRTIYNRIVWDEEFYAPEDCIIGYLDRFVGIVEVPFGSFTTDPTDPTGVPFHRIRYFKHAADGNKIWERRIAEPQATK